MPWKNKTGNISNGDDKVTDVSDVLEEKKR